MNTFLGYNFCSDGNCLDPTCIGINQIKNTKITNGIYDHFHVTSDVTSAMSTTIPTAWDAYTIMDCDFADNINAGSLSDITKDITKIRVKRREVGSFDWITIKEVTVSNPNQISFIFNDYLTSYNTEYEYALVPMINATEGSYVVNTILSNFKGVFMCDTETAFKFLGGVSYGNNTTVQKIGTFEPFGRQYPIIVANALTNYDSGSISGYVLPPTYSDTRKIDKEAIVEERRLLMEFLTNKKAKVLKDDNGNIWLLVITGSPVTSYNNNMNMSVIKTNVSWTQIGDANTAEDLYYAGLIPTTE